MLNRDNQFFREISEQPRMLHKVVGFYRKEGMDLLDRSANIIKSSLSPVFLGMGSSGFAPYIIRDLLIKRVGIKPDIWDAGEFLHSTAGAEEKFDVVVGISQSGESVETRQCFERLKDKVNLISITNNPDSALASSAGISLPIHAGKETSISNKSYTNTLAVLLMLGYKTSGRPMGLLFYDLEKCADDMQEYLDNRSTEMEEAALIYSKVPCVNFISRGPSITAAMQSSLTWMEGTHIPSSVFTGGSFRHGPYELIGQDHHAVCFAPSGHNGMLVTKMAVELAHAGSIVVLYTIEGNVEVENIIQIKLQPVQERLFSLLAAIPQELLMAETATLRGMTPGEFTRISKITTVE